LFGKAVINYKKTLTSLINIEDDILSYIFKGLLQDLESFFYFFYLTFFLEGIFFVGVNKIDFDLEIPVVLRPNPNRENNIVVNENKVSWCINNRYSVTIDKEITEGIYKMFV
jgi:hypothetical protein